MTAATVSRGSQTTERVMWNRWGIAALVMFIPVYIAQRMAGGAAETVRGREGAEP